MRNGKIVKRAVMVLISFSVMVAGLSLNAADLKVDAAKTQAQLEKEKNDLKKEQAEWDKKLKEAGEARKDQQAYQDALSGKIKNLQSQISTLDRQIGSLNSEIAEKEAAIEQTEKDVKENYDKYKQRLRAMYMSNSTSTLNVLLSSKDIGQFMSRIESVKRISEHDNALIDELRQQVESLKTQKEELSSSKVNLEASKAEAGEKAAELNEAYAQSAEALAALQKEEQEYLEQKEEIDAAVAENEREIAEAIKAAEEARKREEAEAAALKKQQGQSSSSSSKVDDSVFYDSADFSWPLPGFPTITSGYGYRWGSLHAGIDIAGPGVKGQPIKASKAGTVILANRDPGKSYGNYVMVDHGGGYVTLYAHMDSLAANIQVGTKVTKSTTLGYVGNTGNSQGNHLHFEVRLNNVPQNPVNYVTYGR